MSETEEAEALARSKRGQWIISRALCALESKLDATPEREANDLQDVRSLIRAYPAFKAKQQAAEVVAKSTPDWMNDL